MAKTALWWTLAVIAGTVVGMAVLTGLLYAGGLLYPMPPGLDPSSSDAAQVAAMKAWLSTLPAGAFVLALAEHALGCAAGAAVAMLIGRRRSMGPAILVGVLFTIAGVMNLREIPHPSWFGFIDLPLYLIAAVTVARLLVRPRAVAA